MFLGLFSYVLLVDYFPLNVFGGTRSGIRNLPLPITEICLHIFVWGIIMEEGRQVSERKRGFLFEQFMIAVCSYALTYRVSE